jgi:hypothetical protein
LTINELLAMLGRAWPRLLIYPGGLVALALVWLLVRTKNQEPRISRPTNDQRLTTTASEYVRQSIEAFRFSILHSQFPIPNFWLDLSAIVLPWLGLALLPLPHAAAIGRQTDLIAVFALLEWPLLLTIAAERDGDAASQRRLAAILNGYPPLILATLVQISAAGSFDLAVLARSPAEEAPARVALLRWLGSAAWLLALPPALGVGAFASRAPAARALQIGLGLRAIGLIAIAALPWFPLVVTIDR